MKATPNAPQRRFARIRWPLQDRFMTPLPIRRPRHRTELLRGRSESDPWWGMDVHPEIHGALRGIAELILWFVAVLAMIWLFAQFWS